MAKAKIKSKKTMDCCIPSSPEQCLYIDLEGKQVAEIKGLEIGEKVQILVEGKIAGLDQRESNYDGKSRQTGSIRVTAYEVTILEDEDNPFTKMADDEDED